MKRHYNFYATLLDKYQNYLMSGITYQKFWGSSESPQKTEEEFEVQEFQSLIDSINRVPFESELADKGTAFNEVIDCIIEHRKSDRMGIKSDKSTDIISVHFKKWNFTFSKKLCIEFAEYLKGSICQYRTESILECIDSSVLLYGYLDELMPFKVVDIKTTSKYNAFKFRNNWQHIVYPYCLNNSGIFINEFEYLVTDFSNVFIESYTFNKENDLPKLIEHCESLIEFIETNRGLITDKKIFNEL